MPGAGSRAGVRSPERIETRDVGASSGRMILPRPGRHPYYIVSGPYTRLSAGTKVLHLLCHALNSSGQNAFMVSSRTNSDLLTPILTNDAMDHHFDQGLTPIVVYPEVVEGNPLHAPLVVRYILNFPGLLGGEKVHDPRDICFGYSAALLKGQGAAHADNVLFLPASDPIVFTPPSPGTPRRGTCFYAGKYKHIHGGRLDDVTRDSVEIHGLLGGERRQTPEELADLFRRSELFYCYENTALAIEAALCECPVVMLPNRYFTHKIGGELLGNDGVAWGNDPLEVQRAKATVQRFRRRYLELVEAFWRQLEHFEVVTQEAAAKTPYVERIGHLNLTYGALRPKGVRASLQAMTRQKGLPKALVWGLGTVFIGISEKGILAFSKEFVRFAARYASGTRQPPESH